MTPEERAKKYRKDTYPALNTGPIEYVYAAYEVINRVEDAYAAGWTDAMKEALSKDQR